MAGLVVPFSRQILNGLQNFFSLLYNFLFVLSIESYAPVFFTFIIFAIGRVYANHKEIDSIHRSPTVIHSLELHEYWIHLEYIKCLDFRAYWMDSIKILKWAKIWVWFKRLSSTTELHTNKTWQYGLWRFQMGGTRLERCSKEIIEFWELG